MQKNNEGYEQPIAFFSKSLRDVALNYNIMEKQAFALVKAIKDFSYILHSHTIAYVPNVVVKDILVAALYTPLGDVEEIFNPLGVSLGGK